MNLRIARYDDLENGEVLTFGVSFEDIEPMTPRDLILLKATVITNGVKASELSSSFLNAKIMNRDNKTDVLFLTFEVDERKNAEVQSMEISGSLYIIIDNWLGEEVLD